MGLHVKLTITVLNSIAKIVTATLEATMKALLNVQTNAQFKYNIS
jgi:hypothetical protein